ncbi:hypothetical protein WH96_06545 [Kiloniella spongiae]|uniref:Uncharacterized protein n=1 Tax=Kiloniella spongiae TaxID=1489064 RepID=A0A0H2MGG9_9PROT|nr:hypothetical protein [Kiloniella spongiae]KLN61306.1 hypothetical protein WH96_06545 [Kiloniella spongiae]
MGLWRNLDELGRSNYYDEQIAILRARYPGVNFPNDPDFYSEYPPVFSVPGIGIVNLDGTVKDVLTVDITEGNLVEKPMDWLPWILGAMAVLAIS